VVHIGLLDTWNDLTTTEVYTMAILKKYTCHKTVHAYPLDRGEYNNLKGWAVPIDEDPTDEGFVVIYNKGTSREYVSWSPAAVFNEGYTETEE
jgi:hypothetical protein